MSLSPAALAAALAQETEQVFLVCCRVSHGALTDDIRAVHDNRPLTHQGREYLAYPFSVTLPEDTSESLPAVRLTISNVDRVIVESLRGARGAAQVELFVVLASQPDVIEKGPYRLKLREAKWTSLTVEGTCRGDDLLDQAYPGYRFTPGLFPGLF